MVETTTEADFRKWFESAKPNDEFVYNTGFQLGVKLGQRYVSSGAMAARIMYDAGLVELVQRRSYAVSGFEYIAVRRDTEASIPLLGTFMSLGLTNRNLVMGR